jgi:hypothetical protein
MGRKSQITIFLILFMVLLILFGFLFFVRSQVTEAGIEEKVEKAFKDFLQRTSLSVYVQECLELTAKDAIVLAGIQGGILYDLPGLPTFTDYNGPYIIGGERNIPFDYQGTIYPLRLALLRPRNIGPLNHNNYVSIPDYPYSGALLNKSIIPDVEMLFNSDSGTTIQFPALCDNRNQSSNFYGVVGAGFSCEDSDYKLIENTQNYLEKEISNKIQTCTDFQIFKSELGYNITEGNPKVDVLFGEEDVIVLLGYPLIITFKGNPPLTKVTNFSIDLPVRFKKMYHLAKHTVRRDSRDIFYNITNVIELNDCCVLNTTSQNNERNNCTVSCSHPGMVINKIPDYCQNRASQPFCNITGNFTDILNITDNHSLIKNKPLSLFIAIENRRPALDYISATVNQSFPYYTYLEENYGPSFVPVNLYNKTTDPLNTGDQIQVYAGDEILILPIGIDPDEDNLSYKYHGWKSNRNVPTGFCSGYGPQAGATNFWETSRNYTLGFNTTSQLRKDAKIITIPADVDPHCIMINVSDNEGLIDYQVIHILVK